ncbi:MAG: leucine-rich repeat protein, partial [Candidatus Methanomethylophilaceae archaeon]|nr:leucine-rich repeat protein [Candidatus Methanomethylophilaceae archaeon]
NTLEPTLKNLRGHDFSRSGKALRMVTGEVTEFSVGGISYSVTSPGAVAVTGYEGEVSSVPCEASYEGVDYAVTSIGKGAFLRCPTLTSVDLTNVRTLEFKALGNCTGIEEIVFGDCLESIGSYALYGLSFYDGDERLRATPDALRGHTFSGTEGKLFMTHAAKILVEDQYGVYFWTEGVGETIADCIANPSPGVSFTVTDASWGKYLQGINGLDGALDYSSYWAIYTLKNGEWVPSDLGVSSLETKHNPVVGFFYVETETEAPYDVITGGPENVAVPSVSSAKVWDGKTDGTTFCIQGESGLYFYISNATGSTMAERFKAATAAYKIPYEESDYGISSIFGIGTAKKTDSEGNPVIDPATGYEVWNYWAQYGLEDDAWAYMDTTLPNTNANDFAQMAIVYGDGGMGQAVDISAPIYVPN